MMHINRSRRRNAAAVAALALLTAACGGGGTTEETVAPDTTAPAIGLDLRGVCPDNVVIQTDWNPEAEHGFVYNLVGPNYTVDTEKGAVKGDLWSGGRPTGVQVEIRAGGPAIGYGSVTAELYSRPEVLMGFVNTDASISFSGEKPTVGVFTPFIKNPQIIMWDPATYPDVKTIADLKDKGVKVRYFNGVTFIDYLIGAGILDAAQTDGTYDGTPASYLAAGGKDAQQGFATSEPFFYEKKLDKWLKPVAYQLVHDTGWQPYAQVLALTPEALASNRECLAKLVPAIQQSLKDYVGAPDRANEIIVDAVLQYNNAWVYDMDQAVASLEKQLSDGIVANGPDGVLGSFDPARVQSFIDVAVPIFEAGGTEPKKGLTASDLVTNEFIDTSISLD
ncbi:MAG: ABC transporter substrate-binding protein [Ilumatobacteraceae bacterium]